jgi:polar amino acid transport system substrate-binding protein
MNCEWAKGFQPVDIRTWAALLISIGLPFVQVVPASAATLDRVRQTGKLMLGYQTDAQPFSYKGGDGQVTGYSVALCERVAEEVKAQLGVAELAIEWVPVSLEDSFGAVAQGKIDLLCAAETETLERRKQVSFSLPIFPSGTAALLRADAPAPLQDVLAGRPQSGPIWRGSPARILEAKTFSAVAGTKTESWLRGRLKDFQLDARVVPVDSYAAGIARVLDHSSDVFFGDRPILADAIAEGSSAGEVVVIDKLFTYEPIALPLARNDDDFRLAVDRALSQFFRSDEFREVYRKWFGTPDEGALAFFRQTAIPE